MDVSPKISELSVPVVVRRVVADTESGRSVLHAVGLGSSNKFPG
jgi:hypothetical protein